MSQRCQYVFTQGPYAGRRCGVATTSILCNNCTLKPDALNNTRPCVHLLYAPMELPDEAAEQAVFAEEQRRNAIALQEFERVRQVAFMRIQDKLSQLANAQQ